jgi:hypothetical protein
MADVLASFFDMSAPMWLVIALAILQVIGYIRALWATLKQVGRWLRSMSNYAAIWVRRWLGVNRQVTLTQAEYDALPEKEKDTVYMIREDR